MVQNRTRNRARRARVLQMQLLRPRCIICDAPIRYGHSGVRLDSTTCGKRTCATRRWWWFKRERGVAS